MQTDRVHDPRIKHFKNIDANLAKCIILRA